MSVVQRRRTPGRLLVACGLALACSAVGAQRPLRQPVVTSTSPRLPGGHIDVPETYTTGTDLYIADLGFTAQRMVRFTLANRGLDSVSTPFVVDLYLDGERRDTYKVQKMAAKAKLPLVSSLATATTCGPIVLRAVSDPQGVVTEHFENNNELTRTVVPPCADLVVTDLRQDWQDLNTRYRVQVTIANKGSASTAVQTRARVSATAQVAEVPGIDWIYVPPLAPGQSITAHLSGVWLGSSTVDVVLWLDFDRAVPESNEDNNKVTKTFGPH